jgi:hypothetical protein
MKRRTFALTFAFAFALTFTFTFAFAKKPKRIEAEPKVSGATSFKLRSIDLQRRQVLIEVGGLSKAPLANFFTFTDERDRHFVAVNVRCDEPFPSGVRVCEVEMPPGYQKHKLTGLALHLHGLHGKPIAVEADEIADAWDAANGTVNPPTDGGTP